MATALQSMCRARISASASVLASCRVSHPPSRFSKSGDTQIQTSSERPVRNTYVALPTVISCRCSSSSSISMTPPLRSAVCPSRWLGPRSTAQPGELVVPMELKIDCALLRRQTSVVNINIPTPDNPTAEVRP